MTRDLEPRPDGTGPSSWVGKALFDPEGMKLGRVTALASDGVGGVWIDVAADWGALEWLIETFGAAPPQRTFRFHSDDVDEDHGTRLRLKRSMLSRNLRRRTAA